MDSITIYQVVGTPSQVYLPMDGTVTVKASPELHIEYLTENASPREIVLEAPYELPKRSRLCLRSKSPGFHTAGIHIISKEGAQDLTIECHAYALQLGVDSDRDGIVGPDEINLGSWKWGRSGTGATVLVNKMPSLSGFKVTPERMAILSPIAVRPTGYPATDPPPDPSDDVRLVLYVTPNAARRFCIYRINKANYLEIVLGWDPRFSAIQSVSPPLDLQGETLYMEAFEYPNGSFEGLLTLELHLRVVRQTVGLQAGTTFLEVPGTHPTEYREVQIAIQQPGFEEEIVGVTKAIVRVAPWIMTPVTQAVQQVYVCLVGSEAVPNSRFLEDLQKICGELKVHLRILDFDESGGDPFIQDSVEFGYSQGPRHTVEVVCRSASGGLLRSLDLLGKDLGQFEFTGDPSNLDRFGNLEVSPPVKIGGKSYPLGRIIFGGHAYGDFQTREMMPTIRRFLYAQKVQSPIEIYTDWLVVGHVDEILSFVPAATPKGFKLLMGSPDKALSLLRDAVLRSPKARMFQGEHRCDGAVSAEALVTDLVNDAAFVQANKQFQSNMNLNRAILRLELGLEEADIVDIPMLFVHRDLCQSPAVDSEDGRTSALYPNMVNHLVLGSTSVMPRPHGPVIDDTDIFEEAVRASLPDRNIRFVDDWNSYYVNFGDVHCATNTRRVPFRTRWWNFTPDEGFDVTDTVVLTGFES